jgi:hypothetical protein
MKPEISAPHFVLVFKPENNFVHRVGFDFGSLL